MSFPQTGGEMAPASFPQSTGRGAVSVFPQTKEGQEEMDKADKVQGTLETLSSLQLTEDMKALDAQSKKLLHSREVLAIILQEVVEEYQGYSRQEIMDFIEMESLREGQEVSPDRARAQIQGSATEFTQLNERASRLDVAFQALNPRLSVGMQGRRTAEKPSAKRPWEEVPQTGNPSDEKISGERAAAESLPAESPTFQAKIQVNLHIDVEAQKTYRPGYPIEKRGVYYEARTLTSQLPLASQMSDYGKLEKCYSIWICRDDVPKKGRYGISFYKIVNTKNIGENPAREEDYDLMTLVIIRLGSPRYERKQGDEGDELFRFLNLVMYPHKKDFMKDLSEYIDFSENEELWKEVPPMEGLGLAVYEDGLRDGLEQGHESGRAEGIAALVQDHLEEQVPREKTLAKLQKLFGLPFEEAEAFYDRYSQLDGESRKLLRKC